jgi:hypothetical protein
MLSVIPLGGTAVNSLYPGSTSGIGDKMTSEEGVSDVVSSPASLDKDDEVKSAIQDTNSKGKDEPNAEKADKKGADPSGGSNSPVYTSATWILCFLSTNSSDS